MTNRKVAALMVVLAAGAAIPALSSSIWLLAVLLFLGGIAIAPTFGALYSLTASQAPPDRQTEAFGWLSSGFQGGIALGAITGGAIVQAAGSRVAFGASAGVVLVGATVLGRWKPPPPPTTAVDREGPLQQQNSHESRPRPASPDSARPLP